jgi:hypothetical protein
MSNPRSQDERAFGELLRQEAQAGQPEFSERLHRDICYAVRQSHADHVSNRVPHRRGPLWRWALPAAAAVLMLAVFFGWRNGNLFHFAEHRVPGASDPGSIAVAHLPAAPSLPGLMDRAALEVDRLITEKLVAEQWAYLEHDALVLANAVTGGSLRRFVQPSAGAPAVDHAQSRPEG